MRCLMASLTILLTISAAQAERVRLCVLFCVVESGAAVDSYTALYEPVIRSPSDSSEIKSLSRSLRARITKNDAQYRCSQGWNHPVCNPKAGN